MKKPILLLTGTILAIAAYLTIPRIIKSNSINGFSKEEEFEHENEGEEEDEKESGAASQLMSWFQAKGYPDASNLSSKYQAAWEQYLELKSKSNPVYRGQSASNWTQMGYCLNGSTRIGGRIVCMAIDPNNTNNLWVGSAGGGIWKSTNAGTSWTPVQTNLPVLGVSSIIINPTNSNEIYAGTGEVYHTEVSVMGFNVWKTRGTYGIGVIKSTDGGATWTQVMPKFSSDLFAVSSMAFLPGTPTTVFACATDGLYRTTNGGTSWSKIYTGNNIRDIAINPSNTNIIVISVGNMTNLTKGIFRTTNGSNALPTWGKISSGLPSSFDGYINMDNAGSGMLIASIGISSGTANNEIYRSTDFGATWNVQSASNHCDYQFWFAHTAAVNPFSTDSIIYGGVNLYRQSSGSSRSSISGPHADQHDVKFDPVRRGYVYVCNDGGVYKSTNGGSSFTAINNGLNATQFYASLGASKTNANRMAGGLQDNGQVIYNGTNWIQTSWGGGDGTSCAISPSNDNNILVSRDARQIFRSTDGGSSGSSVTNYWGFVADSRTAFVAPVAFAPTDGTIVYQASDNLHKSTNSGNTFTYNSYSTATNYIDAKNKTAIALAVSPTNANKLYVSTSPYAQYDNDVNNIYVTGTPNILKTTSGATPFTSIKGSLPDRFVMDFAISRNNDDSVYIVLGGFGTSHVYLTPDGGTTWVSKGAGLPDVPFNAIVIDPVNPGTIYAGCDFGVYVSPDKGTTWYDYNTNFFDATLVMDLQIDANNKLIAATHGKGVFRSDLFTHSTLPVVIKDFTGIAQDGKNLLQWVVEQEQGLSRYELERSENGTAYSKIYTIAAQDRSSYSYIDNQPFYEGYYRLKMIDVDGTVKYSTVVFLRQALQNAAFKVMGNPFKESIVLNYKIPQQGIISLLLYNQSGSLIKREEHNTPAGNGFYVLHGFDKISSGAYYLKIIYNKEINTIVLQKGY